MEAGLQSTGSKPGGPTVTSPAARGGWEGTWCPSLTSSTQSDLLGKGQPSLSQGLIKAPWVKGRLSARGIRSKHAAPERACPSGPCGDVGAQTHWTCPKAALHRGHSQVTRKRCRVNY